MKKITIGLCSGRHPLPVDKYLFPEELNPTDFAAMERIAAERLAELLPAETTAWQSGDNFVDMYEEVRVHIREAELVIYVTGLTAALIAALNAAKRMGVRSVTLMHFDRESESYIPQRVYGC